MKTTFEQRKVLKAKAYENLPASFLAKAVIDLISDLEEVKAELAEAKISTKLVVEKLDYERKLHSETKKELDELKSLYWKNNI